MQHAVSVTKPGCSCFGKSPLSIDINVAFLQTIPGGFKIAQTVLGFVCLCMISYFCQLFHPMTGSSLGFLCSNAATYFFLITYCCLLTSLILLVCCIFHYFTAAFLPKTIFEFVYHGFACLMYLTSSLALMVTTITVNQEKGHYKEPGYGPKVAVSLLGIVSMSIIAFYCRFIIPPAVNIGFVCGHPDTYFFVVCCSCLVSSFLQLSSCLLSLETSILLSRTLFELLHYLVCFVLYFSSSVALLVNLVKRNKGYVEKENGYDGTIAAASLGLINCCMYGGSVAWFFINRKSTS